MDSDNGILKFVVWTIVAVVLTLCGVTGVKVVRKLKEKERARAKEAAREDVPESSAGHHSSGDPVGRSSRDLNRVSSTPPEEGAEA